MTEDSSHTVDWMDDFLDTTKEKIILLQILNEYAAGNEKPTRDRDMQILIDRLAEEDLLDF